MLAKPLILVTITKIVGFSSGHSDFNGEASDSGVKVFDAFLSFRAFSIADEGGIKVCFRHIVIPLFFVGYLLRKGLSLIAFLAAAPLSTGNVKTQTRGANRRFVLTYLQNFLQ